MITTDIDPDISARLAPSITTAACPGCGRPAQILAWGSKRWYACSPCADAEALRRTEIERRTKALAQWEEVTPDEFRRPLIPSLVHPSIRPALEGDTSGGTCLIGATGCGKTRVAYRLLHAAAIRGQSVFAISHAAFRQAAVSRGDRDPRRADEAKTLIQACRCAKALLIDDVGKGAATDVGDEAFFDLLDHRLSHGSLTHWTANSGSAWLKARFREDRGPAIIRRLRDLTPGRVFVASE
ncbi:MAG: ATP-binding protein [Verrucomicrobiales bacterium]|nr:ATP-binding protein [Verrucomicrobiales bacterium]